jgi:hypothetical protein
VSERRFQVTFHPVSPNQSFMDAINLIRVSVSYLITQTVPLNKIK